MHISFTGTLLWGVRSSFDNNVHRKQLINKHRFFLTVGEHVSENLPRMHPDLMDSTYYICSLFRIGDVWQTVNGLRLVIYLCV